MPSNPWFWTVPCTPCSVVLSVCICVDSSFFAVVTEHCWNIFSLSFHLSSSLHCSVSESDQPPCLKEPFHNHYAELYDAKMIECHGRQQFLYLYVCQYKWCMIILTVKYSVTYQTDLWRFQELAAGVLLLGSPHIACCCPKLITVSPPHPYYKVLQQFHPKAKHCCWLIWIWSTHSVHAQLGDTESSMSTTKQLKGRRHWH